MKLTLTIQFQYKYKNISINAPLESVDLRNLMPEVEIQGKHNNCVAHSVTSAIEYLQRKNGKKTEKDMSRMFVYYNARALDHLENQDNGCTIRSAIKSIVDSGVCPESSYSYSESNLNHKPGFFIKRKAKNLIKKLN